MIATATLATMTPADVTRAYLEDLTLTDAQYDGYMHVRSLHVGPALPYPADTAAQTVARELVQLLPNPSYM